MSMNSDQISRWRTAGLRSGFEVIAPCHLVLSDGSTLEATALVKVGPPRGMVVDPEWSVLEPYAARLVAEGYGYSAVTIDDGEVAEMIRDWSGEEE